ncbi:MAG: DUF424 family protein [Nanoarchaeota archaeon]
MVVIFKTKMEFIVVQKNSEHGMLLIVTDSSLIGKKFEEKNLQLDLTKPFYCGTKCSRSEVKRLMDQARHIHLTGKDAVELGVETGVVNRKKIITIKGVPHAEAIVDG